MCKTWPGFRCSAHPTKAMGRLEEKTKKENKQLKEIQETMESLSQADVLWKDSKAAESYQLRADKLESKIREDLEQFKKEKAAYNMTAKGRKELLDKIENGDLNQKSRLDAELDYSAAELRRKRQQAIQKIIRNNMLPAKVKYFSVKSESLQTSKTMSSMKKNKTRLVEFAQETRARITEQNNKILAGQNQIEYIETRLLQDPTEAEKVHLIQMKNEIGERINKRGNIIRHLREEYQTTQIAAEKISRDLRQLTYHQEQMSSWLTNNRMRGIRKFFHNNNKAIGFFFKYLT